MRRAAHGRRYKYAGFNLELLRIENMMVAGKVFVGVHRIPDSALGLPCNSEEENTTSCLNLTGLDHVLIFYLKFVFLIFYFFFN